MSTNKPMLQVLNETPATKIVTLPEVANKFRKIYQTMNGGDIARAEMKYEQEKFHFMKIIQDNPALQNCTKISLYGCFMDMAVNGLSFESALKHAYVVSFPVNVGDKSNAKWEQRATLMISGYGELHMRVSQKQIKYADNPVLVYEGDHFVTGTKNNQLFLEHTAAYPRKSDNILACYLRITRNDDSIDYKVLSMEEVEKLKKFSKSPNSKAWTDGLPGMIQAKVLKHAFRSYPKIRVGDFSNLASNIVDEDGVVIDRIDYGINSNEMPTPNEGAQFVATMVVEPVANENEFATPEEKPAAPTPTEDDAF